MVLQRAPKRNRIFGYGNPGARIEIDDGQTIYQSDVNGNFNSPLSFYVYHTKFYCQKYFFLDYRTWSVILNPKQEPPISEPIKISQVIILCVQNIKKSPKHIMFTTSK